MAIEKVGPKAIQTYGTQKDWQVNGVNNQTPVSQAPEAPKPKRDRVQISEAAQRLQRAQKAVKEAPDVRQDKVAALRKQIKEGTYNVPADVLLDKILGGSGNNG